LSLFYRNESLRVYFRKYPVTSIILLLNLSMFLLITLAGGTTKTRLLLAFGAYYKPLVISGDWYRLILPIFIHMGWEHLLFNSFAIYIFAPGLEQILGKLRYGILYLFSGISGFVATFLFAGSSVLAAGASGAIFGIYGMYAYLARYRKDIIDLFSRKTIMPILIFGVITTFALPGISISGHLGGLLFGYISGFLFVKR
jgi:rhomboid protease GluP